MSSLSFCRLVAFKKKRRKKNYFYVYVYENEMKQKTRKPTMNSYYTLHTMHTTMRGNEKWEKYKITPRKIWFQLRVKYLLFENYCKVEPVCGELFSIQKKTSFILL